MMNDQEKTATNCIGQCRQRLSQQLRLLASFLSLLLLFTSAAFAQLTTADILGTVTDATGAVVPNATIVLTNTGTNEKRPSTSNGSGDYSLQVND